MSVSWIRPVPAFGIQPGQVEVSHIELLLVSRRVIVAEVYTTIKHPTVLERTPRDLVLGASMATDPASYDFRKLPTRIEFPPGTWSVCTNAHAAARGMVEVVLYRVRPGGSIAARLHDLPAPRIANTIPMSALRLADSRTDFDVRSPKYPPLNPKRNEAWVDDAGELRTWDEDARRWKVYEDLPEERYPFRPYVVTGPWRHPLDRGQGKR